MKIGSLFDGSGGFPLAASMCGIEPVWASEVEPYPIAVTRSNFPDMKHLGDVSKINGAEIEPVDVITFGSPCQDMSIAGKRAGIKHEGNGDEETTRSGLFMEAARIITEMRDATDGMYPAFAVWENVPGAFSSNKGEDFRLVLETLIKIVEPAAVVPAIPEEGWPYADCYRGDGWSLAYRTFDAQYWGVPQRRRRIYLVFDLRGQRAGEILFKREGLRGYFETGRTPWKGTATDAERGSGTDDKGVCIQINTMIATRGKSLGRGTGFGIAENGDPQFTISAAHEHAVCIPLILDDQGGSHINVITDGNSSTIRREMHGNVPCVIEAAGFKAGQSMWGSIGYQEECAATLSAQASGTEPTVCIVQAAGFKAGQGAQARSIGWEMEKTPTLAAEAGGNGDGKVAPTITGDHNDRVTDYTALGCDKVYCLQGNGIDRADTAGCNGKGWKEGKSYTLNTIDRPAVEYVTDVGFFNSIKNISPTILARGYKDPHIVSYERGSDSFCGADVYSGQPNIRYIVRRLTPTECARLQGFPDKWGHPDYKDDLTDEEYRFWLKVRNTYATINGKDAKNYSREQMLTWYNKLHTDSAEYKMWGNGIALPNALYVMQGIAEVEHER